MKGLTAKEVTTPEIGGWGWLAMGAFAAIAILTILIAWPYEWKFAMGPTMILRGGASRKGDASQAVEKTYAAIARFHHENFQENRDKLHWLFHAVRLQCGLLVLEALFWILDLT